MLADHSKTGTHPGKVLAITLRNLRHSKSDIARFLGISRQTLYEILGSRQSITAAVAIRVSRLTGTKAEMWMNLQSSYDLAQARTRLRGTLEHIPQLQQIW